jgi:hypothetical protein
MQKTNFAKAIVAACNMGERVASKRVVGIYKGVKKLRKLFESLELSANQEADAMHVFWVTLDAARHPER